MIRLFAFLGNIGKEYSGNRHNIAWQFLDSMSISSSLSWNKGFHGKWAQYETSNGRVWFIKPETYMNASGESVAEIAKFYKIPVEEILVIHDELELDFGFFSLKKGGGLGGHNGLRSMKDHFGSPDFLRMRFGLGRPSYDDIASYVLADFSKDEKEKLLCTVFPYAERVFNKIIDEGFEKAFASNVKVNTLKD